MEQIQWQPEEIQQMAASCSEPERYQIRGWTKQDWLRRICNAKIEEEKQATMVGELDQEIHMEPLDF
jgi:hypothetical protein